VLQIT